MVNIHDFCWSVFYWINFWYYKRVLDLKAKSLGLNLSPIGQGGLACCDSWGHRVGHDWATDLIWSDWEVSLFLIYVPAFFNLYELWSSPFKWGWEYQPYRVLLTESSVWKGWIHNKYSRKHLNISLILSLPLFSFFSISFSINLILFHPFLSACPHFTNCVYVIKLWF